MTVQALDIFAKVILVPQEECVDRFGVYGLAIVDGKVLLVRIKDNHTLWFPGGALEKDENQEQALQREFLEETGLHATIGKKLFESNYYFHHNPSKKTYHCFNTYYLCSVDSSTVSPHHVIHDEIADYPHWEVVQSLRQNQFHPVAWPVIEKLNIEMEGSVG